MTKNRDEVRFSSRLLCTVLHSFVHGVREPRREKTEVHGFALCVCRCYGTVRFFLKVTVRCGAFFFVWKKSRYGAVRCGAPRFGNITVRCGFFLIVTVRTMRCGFFVWKKSRYGAARGEALRECHGYERFLRTVPRYG